MKLSLFQKGLVVVGILLCAQLGFLAFYGTLLHHAEEFAEEQARNAAVIGRANWISAVAAAETLCAVNFIVTDDQRWQSVCENCQTRIPQDTKSLVSTVLDAPSQMRIVSGAEQKLENLQAILNQAIAQRQSADRQKLRALLNGRIWPLAQDLFAVRHALLTDQMRNYRQDALESMATAMPQVRFLRDQFIWLLIALDVLGAIWLITIYTRGLTSRLSLLAENAQRVARKEQLHGPVGGTDEIANLDNAFHKMAASLTQAEQRKKEFVSMITHDLRSPLTSVQMTLEFIMKKRPDIDDELKEWLERSSRNILTMLSLINELLEYDKIESGGIGLDYDNFELQPVIEQVADALVDIAEFKKINLVIPQTDVELDADAERLMRALMNLLANAIKFSPPQSTVTISVQDSEDTVTIGVADQGRGIPADFIEKVFMPFQQVTADDARKLGGTGLGLAITKSIIEAHHGKIDVQSELGKGTTFKLTLPKTRAAPPGTAPPKNETART